jgi:hypothetical protein
MPDETPAEAAEQAALWWVDHVRNVNEYALSCAGRSPGRRTAARETLWRDVLQWGDVVGHPLAAALMGDHVSAVKFFADSAAKGNRRDMDAALDMMLDNLDDQSRLYRADSPLFPADTWRDLFAKHIAYTAQYMEALLVATDIPGYEADYRRAQENRNRLAAFSKEHLAVKTGPPAKK